MRGAFYLLLVFLAAAVSGGRSSAPRRSHSLCHSHLDLEHFAKFCATLTLPNGKRLELEPFQRTLLGDYFNGSLETLILIPKKNGKTTLMAALVLYHLCYVDSAECFVAASSRDQAMQLYRFAQGFILKSAALQRRVLLRPGTREIRARRDEGFVRIIAADAETADGVAPTLAIVDELHRQKSTALYGVFRDGLDARDGAMLTISTAGDDEEGPLGQMRTKALAMKGVKRRGRYTYARSPDRRFALHEWALRPTDDLEDLNLVLEVNPLRRMTKAKLRSRRHSPSMTLPTWARFACNVWTQGDDAAIATLDWSNIARRRILLPDGPETDVVIGIDLGWTKDSTAFVPVGYSPDRELALVDQRLRVIYPPGDRTMVDEELLKDSLREMAERWPEARYAIDPNAGGQGFAQWIVRELCFGDDERVVEVSQQPAPMQETSMHFSDGIRSKRVEEELDEHGDVIFRTVPLRHPDHPELNRHIRAAVARWNGERWRLDKRTTPRDGNTRVAPRPIDAAIAAALAYLVLTTPVEEPLEPFALVG